MTDRSRRILITGLSHYWGGRLAQTLEADPEIETIVGVDTEDPTLELRRTEFVRVGTHHALLRRIVEAASIDTVIDTRLVVDSAMAARKVAHEVNVIGTMNVLAAGSGTDSPVRKLVFKSSAHYYGANRDDPAFFEEHMRRPHAARTPIERDIVEAEEAVAGFAHRNRDTTVTVLRFCNGIGPDLRTSHMELLGLPAVPCILGFDPRYQFVHEDDMAGALDHALRNDLAGIYNVAADGVLALSEVASLLGKPLAPVIPPYFTGQVVFALRRLGLTLPPEMLNQLRYGRGIDNRRLKASGYVFRHTTREAVVRLAEHQRLAPFLDREAEGYRYEREVEEFLRRSPSVRREGPAVMPAIDGAAVPDGYDRLGTEEVLALLVDLDTDALHALRAHEAAGRDRPAVVSAVDAVLARRAAG